MTDPLRDISPRNPPIIAGENPFLVWIRYGLGDLFFWVALNMGEMWLDEVPAFIDGLRFVVLDALQEAKGRMRERERPRPPNSFRLDTTDLEREH